MQKQRTLKLSRFAALLVGAWSWQTASAVDVSWTKMPGAGLHIAGNNSGANWMIGLDRVSESGYGIYRFHDLTWNRQAGEGRRIAVDSRSVAWMVDDRSRIYRYNAGSWQMLPGLGTDIAAGGDGSIWLVSPPLFAGMQTISKWNDATQNWTLTSIVGSGPVRIAVERDGTPWLVNSAGQIFRYNRAYSAFSLIPGLARSVHTGMQSGNVWVIGTSPIVGGYEIFRYVPEKQGWEPYGSYGAVGITEVGYTPWIIQADGSTYYGTIWFNVSTTGSPDLIITSPPPPTPQPDPPVRISGTGKLLCSNTGAADTGIDQCGVTKADYVGAYALDTTCDGEGSAPGDIFYDMIYGGTCWKCPADTDGRGSWIRSGDAVDKDSACWRVPMEATGKAIKVKSPSLSWDCPSGSFWDGYSPDGAGGSCWKCPDDLPRRTAAAVWADNACATSLNETRPAILLTFNGCPTPNASNMDLPGKRSPGKPFLDIAAGWSQGVASGGCYACPITDEAGNFLITERNANAIYDRDNNSGCTIKFKWRPFPFYEPGLAYMQGVKDVIMEQRLFDGNRITGLLYDLAESRGLGDATPEAKAWVAARWQEIAKNPYNSESLRTLVFTLLKSALKKNPNERTPGEQKLIQSFADYVRDRRIYLAEQGLQMYDAWKAYDDQYRQQTGQTKSLSQLFYYGTVPLDFHGTIGSLIGLGGAGGGLIGSMVGAAGFVQGVTVGKVSTGLGKTVEAVLRETTLQHLSVGLNLLKALQTVNNVKAVVQAVGVVSGASAIGIAAAILTSISMDQLIAIESARPKLEASLEQAKEPVDLNILAKSTNGEDMLYFFWAKAMDKPDTEDPQVVELAAQAQARAQQSGYLAPPKQLLEVTVGETSVGDRISSGTGVGYLRQNQKLVSHNGKYEAVMQGDGNFVIYAENRQPIWATGTNGSGTPSYTLAMQADSNLVVYGSSGPTWASGIRSGTAPFTLIMQDNGNLVVYDSTNRAIWASNTQR